MRDPKRIKEILGVIEQVWTKNPDLRLMQLLLNAVGVYYESDCNSRICGFNICEIKDHYNTEDTIVLEKLKKTYGDLL